MTDATTTHNGTAAAAASPITYAPLGAGDPAPWFRTRTSTNPNYAFETVAGRSIVLCFFASAADPQSRAALDAVIARREMFDDERACFFGVSVDPADEREGRVRDSLPGLRFFWDIDGAVSRLYGALPRDAKPGDSNVAMRRFWVVLDPRMRVSAVIPFAPDGSDRAALFEVLARQEPAGRIAGFDMQAPVLLLPDVFEPAFCDHLIAQYEKHGGTESGFMQERDGKTVLAHDHAHKRRRDYDIADRALIQATQARIRRRIVPEIARAHQFHVTRMERYIVSCYAAEDAAHFRAHRDNTTKGTAHRRFAVSINLNADFDGGNLSFPEYGTRTLKPPLGGAVVFSCSLLHAVSQVTRGKRYAFLPFLYDDAAAKLREENNAFLGEGVGGYRAAVTTP